MHNAFGGRLVEFFDQRLVLSCSAFMVAAGSRFANAANQTFKHRLRGAIARPANQTLRMTFLSASGMWHF